MSVTADVSCCGSPTVVWIVCVYTCVRDMCRLRWDMAIGLQLLQAVAVYMLCSVHKLTENVRGVPLSPPVTGLQGALVLFVTRLCRWHLAVTVQPCSAQCV